MHEIHYTIKKTLILFGLLVIQYGKAQNISVSVVNDMVVMMMSGPTTISNLSSSLNSGSDTLTLTTTISGTLSLSGIPAGVSVNNGNKTTIIDLTTFNTFSGIELIGSSSNDVVTIGSGGVDFSNVNASADLYIYIELGNGTDVVNVSNPLVSKGAGEISINASKSIVVTANIAAETGGIYLTSNLQPIASSGNFRGVDVSGNITTDATNGGAIYIEAKGGNSGNNNYGVFLHNGKIIKAGGMSPTTVIGNGGASTGDNNYGVYITGAGSVISASGGPVNISGYGGGTGALSSENIGVTIDSSGGTVTNAGTDSFASVTIIGYAGNGINDSEIGVNIQSEVSSSGGNINIEGQGGSNAGSFNSNIGLLLRTGGSIHAGGDGDINLVGTATAFQSSSDGIQLRDSVSVITDNGFIWISGLSHSNNFGISFTGSNSIASGNNEPIIVTSNKANLGPMSAGTGTITLIPAMGVDIDLGGSDNIATLGLSSAELNAMSCGHLVIGDTSLSGSIIISNQIDLVSVSDDIELNTGSSILFDAGTFYVGDRSLSISCQSVLRNIGVIDFSDTNSVLALANTVPLSFPQGLLSGNIHNLSINGRGGLTLGDSMTIMGSLELNDGDLSIDNYKLTVNGVIAMSADHGLIGSSSSKLSIGGTSASAIGTLYFSPGGDSLHTFTIDRNGTSGNNAVVLGSDLTVTNTLVLAEGRLALDSQVLTFTGTAVSGGDAGSYIQINGTGGLKQPGGNSIVFPIGNNAYLPLVLSCSSCGSTDFTAQVYQGISETGNSPLTSDVVNATWSVTASASQSADLIFQWPGSAELSMPHTGVTLGTRLSATSSWSQLGSGLTVAGTDPYSVSYSGFSFSGSAMTLFGIGGASTPLPVHIAALDADCKKVAWKLTDEKVNTTYEVLGSVDGLQWETLGKIPGKGNLSQVTSYEFSLPSNHSYQFFRLRMTDHDGQKLSAIVHSECRENGNGYMLYPNPVNNELFIRGMTEGSVIRLYNAMGSVVYETVFNGENGLINMQEMIQGLYILYIDDKVFSILKT